MKRRSLLVAEVLSIAFLRICCFGQTDTNLLATEDWSEVVRDRDEHSTYALRGRLLVYDDQTQSAANHARVYLELQNVFEGGWSVPLEVYFELGVRDDLHFEMRDALDRPIPQQGVSIRGSMPEPYHIILYCLATQPFDCAPMFIR